MSHIGIICPPVTGHLNPMLALGRELLRRGHRVTLFGVADAEPAARAAGIDACVIGRADFPMGTVPRLVRELGALSGARANLRWHRNDRALAEAMCRDGIGQIGAARIDGLLIDQMDAAGASVAEALAVPSVTVCVGLPAHRERGMPPIYTPWSESRSPFARARADIAFAIAKAATHPVQQIVDGHRRRWGLAVHQHGAGYYQESRLAIIAQLCAALDFDRALLPPWFHYVGLLRSAEISEGAARSGTAASAFPVERLTGAPLIYASLGTMIQAKPCTLRAIAHACAGAGAQLVLALGGDARLAGTLGPLAADTLVMDYAPQLEILPRASLTITHGGLNTVLESLAFGVPAVLMPIAFDQPGVGARVAKSGAGVVVRAPRRATRALRDAVRKVLADERYRGNARRLQAALARCGGVPRAAEIAERAIATGAPVLREIEADVPAARRVAR